MAHPEIAQGELAQSEIALITLVDGRAPYKGTWCLVRHAAADNTAQTGDPITLHGNRPATAELEAVHTTYHPDHGPGCEIERLSLAGEDLARQFVRHLLLHNWHVHNVHHAGEGIWAGLPR